MQKEDIHILKHLVAKYKDEGVSKFSVSEIIKDLKLKRKDAEKSFQRLNFEGYCTYVTAKADDTGDVFPISIKLNQNGVDFFKKGLSAVSPTIEKISPYRNDMIRSDTLLVLKLILIAIERKQKPHPHLYKWLTTENVEQLLRELNGNKKYSCNWDFKDNYNRTISQEITAIFRSLELKILPFFTSKDNISEDFKFDFTETSREETKEAIEQFLDFYLQGFIRNMLFDTDSLRYEVLKDICLPFLGEKHEKYGNGDILKVTPEEFLRLFSDENRHSLRILEFLLAFEFEKKSKNRSRFFNIRHITNDEIFISVQPGFEVSFFGKKKEQLREQEKDEKDEKVTLAYKETGDIEKEFASKFRPNIKTKNLTWNGKSIDFSKSKHYIFYIKATTGDATATRNIRGKDKRQIRVNLIKKLAKETAISTVELKEIFQKDHKVNKEKALQAKP